MRVKAEWLGVEAEANSWMLPFAPCGSSQGSCGLTLSTQPAGSAKFASVQNTACCGMAGLSTLEDPDILGPLALSQSGISRRAVLPCKAGSRHGPMSMWSDAGLRGQGKSHTVSGINCGSQSAWEWGGMRFRRQGWERCWCVF